MGDVGPWFSQLPVSINWPCCLLLCIYVQLFMFAFVHHSYCRLTSISSLKNSWGAGPHGNIFFVPTIHVCICTSQLLRIKNVNINGRQKVWVRQHTEYNGRQRFQLYSTHQLMPCTTIEQTKTFSHCILLFYHQHIVMEQHLVCAWTLPCVIDSDYQWQRQWFPWAIHIGDRIDVLDHILDKLSTAWTPQLC